MPALTTIVKEKLDKNVYGISFNDYGLNNLANYGKTPSEATALYDAMIADVQLSESKRLLLTTNVILAGRLNLPSDITLVVSGGTITKGSHILDIQCDIEAGSEQWVILGNPEGYTSSHIPRITALDGSNNPLTYTEPSDPQKMYYDSHTLAKASWFIGDIANDAIGLQAIILAIFWRKERDGEKVLDLDGLTYNCLSRVIWYGGHWKVISSGRKSNLNYDLESSSDDRAFSFGPGGDIATGFCTPDITRAVFGSGGESFKNCQFNDFNVNYTASTKGKVVYGIIPEVNTGAAPSSSPYYAARVQMNNVIVSGFSYADPATIGTMAGSNCSTGLYLQFIIEFQWNNCYFEGNFDGMRSNKLANRYATTVSFNNCQFRTSTRHGAFVQTVVGLTFNDNCVFESNGGRGFYCEPDEPDVGTNKCEVITFINPWFEANNQDTANYAATNQFEFARYSGNLVPRQITIVGGFSNDSDFVRFQTVRNAIIINVRETLGVDVVTTNCENVSRYDGGKVTHLTDMTTTFNGTSLIENAEYQEFSKQIATSPLTTPVNHTSSDVLSRKYHMKLNVANGATAEIAKVFTPTGLGTEASVVKITGTGRAATNGEVFEMFLCVGQTFSRNLSSKGVTRGVSFIQSTNFEVASVANEMTTIQFNNNSVGTDVELSLAIEIIENI